MPKPMVYVCSPLRAATKPEMRRNMHNARRLMAEIAAETGKRAVAPQAFLPEFLDDSAPEERALALMIGAMLLERCDSLIVCGETVSSGMRDEIRQAERLGIPVLKRAARNLYEAYPLPLPEYMRKGA